MVIRDNPVVAVVMETQDGAKLRWRFSPPVPQAIAMMAFGFAFGYAGVPKMPQLELVDDEEPEREV